MKSFVEILKILEEQNHQIALENRKKVVERSDVCITDYSLEFEAFRFFCQNLQELSRQANKLTRKVFK